MYKYDPLSNFFIQSKENRIRLTFQEIEEIISDELPISASKYREWWANGGHVQANAWLDAGYRVHEVKIGEYVEFVKKTEAATPSEKGGHRS